MSEVRIDREVCENSQFCVEVCPEDVFEVRSQRVEVAHPERCTVCWLCVQDCPTGAIEVE